MLHNVSPKGEDVVRKRSARALRAGHFKLEAGKDGFGKISASKLPGHSFGHTPKSAKHAVHRPASTEPPADDAAAAALAHSQSAPAVGAAPAHDADTGQKSADAAAADGDHGELVHHAAVHGDGGDEEFENEYGEPCGSRGHWAKLRTLTAVSGLQMYAVERQNAIRVLQREGTAGAGDGAAFETEDLRKTGDVSLYSYENQKLSLIHI